jgi:hypothetical protein
MIRYFPYEKKQIKSSLNKDEILERINGQLQFSKGFWGQNKNSFKNYEGYTKDDYFKFKRVMKLGHNSFIPFVEGQIEDVKGECVVSYEVKFHKFVSVFLFLFILISSVISAFAPYFGLFFSFPFIVYLIAVFAYNYECQLIENDLELFFKEQVINT